MGRSFAGSAALFVERFPHYALVWRSWKSEQPRYFHSSWKEKLPLSTIEVLYLYGMHDGRAILDLLSWLKEKAERRLILLEPNASTIAHLIKQPWAEKIIQENQIEIVSLPLKFSELGQALAQRYPAGGVYIARGPGFSKRDQNRFFRIKRQLVQQTAIEHARRIERLERHLLFSHFLQNANHLPKSFYVNRFKNRFENIPAIICGAGPSLQDAIPELKKLENRALIIAGGSAIAALSSHGIRPHLAVAVDPTPHEMDRLKNNLALEVPLIFSTRLFPFVFSMVNGPFGYMRSAMAGRIERWLENELKLLGPVIGEELPDESFSVTLFCAALADYFGCHPILFDGVDLSYTNRKQYAEGVFAQEKEPNSCHLFKKDRRGKRVLSSLWFDIEAKALSRLARSRRDKKWINCTSHGIKIPGIESKKLSNIHFNQEWDIRGRIHSEIVHAPMPDDAAQRIPAKIHELKMSLDRVIEHLETIIRHPNSGKSALAEEDLLEEMAKEVLFYDMAQREEFLQTARNCRRMFDIPNVIQKSGI